MEESAPAKEPSVPEDLPETPIEEPSVEVVESEPEMIDASGATILTRFHTPSGFERTPCAEDSFGAYLRNYPLKPHESPLLMYDGSMKPDQGSHAAVFEQPMVSGDLQQCAEAIMRMYADYLYDAGRIDKIQFHLTDGTLVPYQSYTSDMSYAGFEKYFRYICVYAGTLSMSGETVPVGLHDMEIGDVFLKSVSPGHACMIVDLCEKDGKKAFLLGESYMPAQEFHVITNPLHHDDPWYYEDEISFPFRTSSYTFPEGSARRPVYLQ